MTRNLRQGWESILPPVNPSGAPCATCRLHVGQPTVTQLREGEWVRLRFQNDSGRLHPMHIHGRFFKVISRDGKPVSEPYL